MAATAEKRRNVISNRFIELQSIYIVKRNRDLTRSRDILSATVGLKARLATI